MYKWQMWAEHHVKYIPNDFKNSYLPHKRMCFNYQTDISPVDGAFLNWITIIYQTVLIWFSFSRCLGMCNKKRNKNSSILASDVDQGMAKLYLQP